MYVEGEGIFRQAAAAGDDGDDAYTSGKKYVREEEEREWCTRHVTKE